MDRSALLLVVGLALGCNSLSPFSLDGGGPGDDEGQPDSGPVDAGLIVNTIDGGQGGGGDAGTDAGMPDSGLGAIAIPSQAPYDQWTWIDTPGTLCGNGTPTGMAINPHAGATRTLIGLVGGGMCFDYETCYLKPTAYNLDGFDKSTFEAYLAQESDGGYTLGALARDPSNPFANDNLVLVPYCTGDVFAGTHSKIYENPLGIGYVMHHVGHNNIGYYLQQLVPTFAPISQTIVLAGSSAGGLGALINYEEVANAFAPLQTYLIDDSGPVMRDPYLTTGLAGTVWDAWTMQGAVPAGCAKCNPTDGLWNIFAYDAQSPTFRGSLISSEQDQVMSGFFALGNPLMEQGAYFQVGLNDMYTNVIQPLSPGQFHVFFINSVHHVWLVLEAPLNEITSQGVSTSPTGTTLAQFLTEEITPDAGFTDVMP